MGQKMNPNAIRIAANNQGDTFLSVFPGGFVNLWFSDYKYFTFFYKDFVIKKSKIFIMKYYKKRVRFLKGRRRRLKSVLRLSRFSCVHFPYKKQLVCFLLGPNFMGLQRKHTAFTYNFRPLKGGARHTLNNKHTYKRKKENTPIPLREVGTHYFKRRSLKESQQKNVYLKRIKKLAGHIDRATWNVAEHLHICKRNVAPLKYIQTLF